MTEEQRQVNINADIDNGTEMYAHEASVHFGALQFMIDFRCMTPRFDPRTTPEQNNAVILIRHSLIMMDPFQIKGLISILQESVKKYESQFGAIEKPRPLQMIEKRLNVGKKQRDPNLSYLG